MSPDAIPADQLIGYGLTVGASIDDEAQTAATPADAGVLVRRARMAAGVSLRELARRIEVSPGTISAVETGKTQLTFTRLQQIAAALGKTAAELLLNVSMPNAQGPVSEPTNLQQLRRVYSELGSRNKDGGDWRSYEPIPIGPVLLAGLAVFVETGYHGATVRTIADAAGMSVAGIYHYCTSKQDILVRLADEAMADLSWRTRAAIAEGRTVSERLSLLVECLAQYHAQRWAFGRLLSVELRSLEPTNKARIDELRDAERLRLTDCIEAGVHDGTFTTTTPPHILGRAITTMCSALPEWYRPGGQLSPSEIGRQYASIALDMVGAVDRDAVRGHGHATG